MELPFRSWSKTLRALGLAAANKPAARPYRPLQIEPLEIRAVLTTSVGITAHDANIGEASSTGSYFTVTRDNTSGGLTIPFTVGGNATSGVDYQSLGSSVTITDGNSSAQINLTLIDDSSVEGNEYVSVSLTPSMDNSYTIPPLSGYATITIIDDDTAPTVSVTASGTPVEGGAGGTYTISRTGSTAASLSVNFMMSGVAQNGTDYTTIGSSVTIPSGQSSATVNLAVTDDSTVEPSESATLSLSWSMNYTVDTNASSATLNIGDNDYLTVAAGGTPVEGGDTGTFTITRPGSTTSSLMVSYSMSGTATNGADYSSLMGSVTINSGQSSATVTLTPSGDSLVEGPETSILTLSSSSFYTPSPTSGAATLTIADDDFVWVTASGTPSEQGPTTGTFTIHRPGSTSGSLAVSYSISGTATGGGTDYASLSGSVTIASGQSSATVPLVPEDDHVIDAGETVILALNTTADYTASATTATLTIGDNEVWIVAGDDALEQGEAAGTFTIYRNGPTAAALGVTFTMGGTATSGVDYLALPTSDPSVYYTEIPANATSVVVVLSPINDEAREDNETATATLIAPTGYTVASSAPSATINIIDNDQWIVGITAPVGDAFESEQFPGAFEITRSGETDLTYALTVHVEPDSASTASSGDYETLSSTYQIPAGEYSLLIPLVPTSDTEVESVETLFLDLVADSAYDLADNDSAAVAIHDQIFSSWSTASIVENATDTFSVADPGAAGEGSTYSISGGNDAALFSIDPNTGEIAFLTPPDFEAPADADADNAYEVEVQVTDANSNESAKLLTVNVTDVNETPVIADQSFDIAENSANDTAVGTVVATDPDADQSLTYSIIDGNDSDAFVIDDSTGAITVGDSAQLDYETVDGHAFTLTVQVTDDAADSLLALATVTMNLLNVHEVPLMTEQTFSAVGNSAVDTVIGTVGATADTGLTIADFSITAGNGSGAFTIDSSTGEITVADSDAFDYLLVEEHYFVLTISATDDGETELSNTTTITISPPHVNQAPTITATSQLYAQMNQSLTFWQGTDKAILFADADAGNNPLSVTLTATDGLISLGYTTGLTFDVGDGVDDETMTFSGALTDLNMALCGATFTSTTDFEGDATLDVDIDDLGNTGTGGALTDSSSITITVTNASVVAHDGAFLLDDPATTLVVSTSDSILNNDTAASNQTLTAILAVGPSHGELDLNSDGSFSYTADETFDDLDFFTYFVTDGDDTSPTPAKVNIVKPSVNINAFKVNKSKEDGMLDPAIKKTVGAYLPVNNDFDYYRSPGDEESDLDVEGAIPNELDLLPINLDTGKTAGTVKLVIPANVRVWKDFARSEEVVSGETEFAANSPAPYKLFVEGLQAGTGSIVARFKLAALFPFSIPVDSLKVSTFQWGGPTNVPEYSQYNYEATGGASGAGNSKWLAPEGGTLHGNIDYQGAGNGTDEAVIFWGEGARYGFGIYQATAGYSWRHRVGIIKVEVTTPEGAFIAGTFANGAPKLGAGDVQLKIADSLHGASNGFEWKAKIRLSGPDAAVVNKGVEWIDVGFVQNVISHFMAGKYDAQVEPKRPAVVLVNSMNGNTFLDTKNEATAPWFTKDRAGYFTGTDMDDGEFGDAGKPGKARTLTFQDRPNPGAPLTADKAKFPAEESQIVDRMELKAGFKLDVAMVTRDNRQSAGIAATSIYTTRATLNWRYDASGTVEQIGDYLYSPAEPPPKPQFFYDASWTLVNDGSRPNTAGISANDAGLLATWATL